MEAHCCHSHRRKLVWDCMPHLHHRCPLSPPQMAAVVVEVDMVVQVK